MIWTARVGGDTTRGVMMDGANRSNISERGSPMKGTTLGIDVAKHIFRVHGVDAQGKV